MAISLEIQEKAKQIILAGLRAQSHGSVRFCDIHATVKLNAIDEESLDMVVIYEGPREDLNIQSLISLHGEIRPQLIEAGVLQIPYVGYTDRASYDQMLLPRRQRPAHGTGKTNALARPHRNRSLANHYTASQYPTFARFAPSGSQRRVLRHVPRISQQQR